MRSFLCIEISKGNEDHPTTSSEVVQHSKLDLRRTHEQSLLPFGRRCRQTKDIPTTVALLVWCCWAIFSLVSPELVVVSSSAGATGKLGDFGINSSNPYHALDVVEKLYLVHPVIFLFEIPLKTDFVCWRWIVRNASKCDRLSPAICKNFKARVLIVFNYTVKNIIMLFWWRFCNQRDGCYLCMTMLLDFQEVSACHRLSWNPSRLSNLQSSLEMPCKDFRMIGRVKAMVECLTALERCSRLSSSSSFKDLKDQVVLSGSFENPWDSPKDWQYFIPFYL